MTASFSEARNASNVFIVTVLGCVNRVRPKRGVRGGGFSHRQPPASSA